MLLNKLAISPEACGPGCYTIALDGTSGEALQNFPYLGGVGRLD
jgi:hypothetical protein